MVIVVTLESTLLLAVSPRLTTVIALQIPNPVLIAVGSAIDAGIRRFAGFTGRRLVSPGPRYGVMSFLQLIPPNQPPLRLWYFGFSSFFGFAAGFFFFATLRFISRFCSAMT